MTVMKSRPWVIAPTRADMAPEVEWNRWTRRDWPFKDLAEGDRVVCVSGGGPAEGILMFEARVEHLITEAYGSHEHAWQLMRTGMPAAALRAGGVTKDVFLNHEYTLDKPESGWLLAWSSTPTRWLGRPRPADFRFRQNGWANYEGPI